MPALLYIVAAVGLANTVGWIGGIEWLQKLPMGTVTMKMTTGLAFLLSAVALTPPVVQSNRFKRWIAPYMCAIRNTCALAVMVLVMDTIWSAVLGIMPALSRLAPEAADTLYTVAPGQTSLVALACFTLIALKAFRFGWAFGLHLLMGPVLVVSTVGLVGHLIQVPLLYYTSDVSTGMALSTALCFFLLSMSAYYESWR